MSEERTFAAAPRWAGVLNEKLNEVLAGQRRLFERFRIEAAADRERDNDMADITDEIMAKLEASNTRQDSFLVILQSLKDNQNNPAKLQQIARSIDEQQADWEAAFAANTPPEPPAP